MVEEGWWWLRQQYKSSRGIRAVVVPEIVVQTLDRAYLGTSGQQ